MVVGDIRKIIFFCFSIGTPKIINFPFVPDGKLLFLAVPIFKH